MQSLSTQQSLQSKQPKQLQPSQPSMQHLPPCINQLTLVGSIGNAVETRGNSVLTQWDLNGSLVGLDRSMYGASTE